MDNNDLFLNRLVVTPSLDAVQEFTLVQNTYDAEYGRNSGAQVNVVTRSGGSRHAGRLFEYWRDEALDAQGVFDPPGERTPLSAGTSSAAPRAGRSHGFRASFSSASKGCGPATAETRVSHVPTLQERAGDFSASGVVLRDPLTGARSPATGFPLDRLDPAGARVAALYPEPNRATPGQNLASSPEGSRDGLQVTLKTDHHAWRENPFFLRYSLAADDRDQPFPARGRELSRGLAPRYWMSGTTRRRPVTGAAARHLQRGAFGLEPPSAGERAARAWCSTASGLWA